MARRKDGEDQMTEADRRKIESIARALDAYSLAAAANPELQKMLDRVATPGGRQVREFAMMAAGVSSRHRPSYD
jgi:hypothetical protein